MLAPPRALLRPEVPPEVDVAVVPCEDELEVVRDTRKRLAALGVPVMYMHLGEDPHVFVVGAWEKPEGAAGDGWAVPREEVKAKVAEAMDRFQVLELACDPPGWHREIDEWADLYADTVTTEYATNRRAFMAAACSRFYTAATTGGLRHDGDERLARHLANARLKETPDGAYITKDGRMSPRKIDLAVAAVIAFDRASWQTLRRTHYELLSDMSARELGYRNVLGDYKELSSHSARGRRDGTFPDFAETVRSLTRERGFTHAGRAARARSCDRAGGPHGRTGSGHLRMRREGRYPGLPARLVRRVRGARHELERVRVADTVDTLRRWAERDARPLILLYAGDHDASGEDIDRDFRARTGVEVRRVGLLPEQVERYGLPRSPFEKDDSRNRGFVARHGGLWQTELDALDPDALRALFEDAFRELWDMSAYQERLALEAELLTDVLGEAA